MAMNNPQAHFQGYSFSNISRTLSNTSQPATTTSNSNTSAANNSEVYNYAQSQTQPQPDFYPPPPQGQNSDLGSIRPPNFGQEQSSNSDSAGPSRGKVKPKKQNVKDDYSESGQESGHGHRDDGSEDHKKKKTKRATGKACVYCRRSHMVCEGGRPCERCIKREIPHLCRDCSPPPQSHHSPPKSQPQQFPQTTQPLQQQPVQQPIPSSQQVPIFPDTNFPPSWPMLPESTGNLSQQTDFINSSNDPSVNAMDPPPWELKDDGELASLNKFMKDLGASNLPNDFLAFMNQLDQDGSQNSLQVPSSEGIIRQEAFASHGLGNAVKRSGKGTQMSRIDKYLMAAADQPNGTRASRLAQVIKAKYDAGLLRPYDYVKGYERMNKWMDSGRAAPKVDSRANSEVPESPQMSHNPSRARSSMVSGVIPAPAFGRPISPESRRRILAALAGFRPKFRQIARTLTNVDLVFVEEAMERWMLEYDRAFASIHTPSCIWRRTGEIQKANQEFSNLTGISASMFRDGQLCVYELMDEDSAVRYWEGYAKIAFDPSQRSMSIPCTLHIPLSLTHHRPRHLSSIPSGNATTKSAFPHPPQTPVPDLALPSVYGDAASDGGVVVTADEYREMKCMFSATIRRDAWGVPVAIMGQWIPIQ